MNVLILNGSPHEQGNTRVAIDEMTAVFESQGVDVECITVGGMDIVGCKACGACVKLGKCVIDDIVNQIAPKFETADGLVLASPVYFASANGTLISLLDRLFYSTHFDTTMKVGAAIGCARRGGITTTWDELNKYFGISGMPIASGQYWNGIHGRVPGEAVQDDEGRLQMRTLARNMVFLMQCIACGREHIGLPQREPGVMTNFIR